MTETPPEWQNGNDDADKDPDGGSGPLLWFLLGVLPILIGLLIGPASIFDTVLGGQRNALRFLFLVAFSFPCVVLSGIGLCGGFRTRRAGAIIGGICVGLLIGAFDAGVIFFAGLFCAVVARYAN